MILQVKDLSKVFQISKDKKVDAVSKVSFEVEEAEMLAFMGPNGAGKSTTIKMLAGILFPTSGDVQLQGLCPWKDRRKLAFQMGTVFGQKSQLWMHLPPSDTFNLLASIYEISKKDYHRRRDFLVESFDLQELLDVPVRKMSLGQRMRCEVAASLLHKPRILFLDEPTIGLDPVAKSSLRTFIKRANQEEKVTVFLTSHDTGDIEELCKRAIIINQGQMVYDGKVSQLRRLYLAEKMIEIRTQEDIHPTKIKEKLEGLGISILKCKGKGLKLSIDTKIVEVSSILQELLNLVQVADISISDPPLEEVIAGIYQKKGSFM